MVRERFDRSAVGMLVAVGAGIAALALPWWTTSASAGPAGVGVSITSSAGPFYTGPGLAEGWEANLVGVLTVIAILGFLTALLVLLGSVELHPAWEYRIPKIVYGSAGLLAAALVYAALAFGGDAPALGWVAGLAAVVVGPAAAWDVRRRGKITGEEGDPTAGQGDRVTPGSTRGLNRDPGVPGAMERGPGASGRQLAVAGALAAAAFAGWAAVDALDEALGGASPGGGLPEAVVLLLAGGLTVAPMYGALVALSRAAGASGGWAAGGAAYLGIGLLVTATGVGGYVGPGYPPLVLLWPMYVVWLHGCVLGVGLWPCPPG